MFGVVAQPLRTLDRLAGVRDDAIAPAAHLVAEETEAAGRADTDRTFGDHTSLSARAPCRSLFDHEPALGHTYLECRVVKVRAASVLQARCQRFEHQPVQAH